MASKRSTKASCKDCYFKQNMLCALSDTEPCSTFRPAARGLAPAPQMSFHFRPDRTRLLYAFPPASERFAHAD